MALALAPFTALFNEHISIGALVSQILEAIFWLLKKLYEAFLSFIEPFLKKFQAIAYQAGIATKHLQTAFQRINAIMVSFIFVGLSAFQSMQNFIDTVITIIIIICGIMLAIIIILFFILFPFIPLIITVLTVISAVVIGSAASAAADMKGGFCFAPETPIRLPTGATKPISELQVGDELEGGTVEGVLVFDGTAVSLYSLDGIRVSGSHLVQDEQGGWRSVASDPRAVPIQETCPLLYCLNTTRRIIPVLGSNGPVQFRDWEEIEEEDEVGQRGWDELIRSMLGMDQETTQSSNDQDTFCLMSPAIHIRRQNGPCIRLEEVQIGDFVEDEKGGFTRVLGLVEGQVHGSSVAGDSKWISACIQTSKSTSKWTRVTTLGSGSDRKVGRHLITESGTFQTKLGLFRDFTEVGYDRIQETYPFVASRLDGAIKK
jgi:hypothetical protein